MSSKANSFLFDNIDSSSRSLEREIIGLSEQRRPLIITHLGHGKDSAFRIMIMAGQHGDEKYGRRAVSHLVASLAPSFKRDFPHTGLAVLPDANPDGSYHRTRTNSAHVDLNRDHQRLDSQETRVIHSFVRTWKPHIIIDVHNYPSRRKHLLAKNLTYYPDILIDIPTNPAIQILDMENTHDLMRTINRDLAINDFSSDRYTIVKPSGKARHSTGDIDDARNFLSLRYNALTILLEGRNPTREDGEGGKEHIILAQHHALSSLLRWAHKNKRSFMEKEASVPSTGDRIPICSRRKLAEHPLHMKFKNVVTETVTDTVFYNYKPEFEVTKYAKLPRAYAVPPDKKKITEILHRHGFSSCLSNPKKTALVEYHVIDSLKPSSRENRAPLRISVVSRKESRMLDGYNIFPTIQKGGQCLALFLEPESRYGLHRYSELDLTILPNSAYPILRVL